MQLQFLSPVGWQNVSAKCGYFNLNLTFRPFASWLCGISHSLEMLIICRVIQGAVAGPIIPLSQKFITE